MARPAIEHVLQEIRALNPDELRQVEQVVRECMARDDGQIQPAAPTQAQIDAANARLRETIVDLGYAIDSDNEGIDADLAHEYGDDHADLYRTDQEA